MRPREHPLRNTSPANYPGSHAHYKLVHLLSFPHKLDDFKANTVEFEDEADNQAVFKTEEVNIPRKLWQCTMHNAFFIHPGKTSRDEVASCDQC